MVKSLSFGVFLAGLSVPDRLPAGPRYDALLKKEADYARCMQELDRTQADFVTAKAERWNHCERAEDCTYLAYGVNQGVNVREYAPFYHCFTELQNNYRGCEEILRGEEFSCIRDKDYPCYEAPKKSPPELPLSFSCEDRRCVAKFNGAKRPWSMDRLKVGKYWNKPLPICLEELAGVRQRLKDKYGKGK